MSTETNPMVPSFEKPYNPFVKKEFLGFTHGVNGSVESAQFDGEDWYSQAYVDILSDTIRSRSQLWENVRAQRDIANSRLALLAGKVSEYLAEHDDDETVGFFSEFINDDYGVVDPRRKDYEIEVVVTLKHTYRVSVRCTEDKYDDMLDLLQDKFHDEEAPSRYDLENEWLVIDDVDDYGLDVDEVEVAEA